MGIDRKYSHLWKTILITGLASVLNYGINLVLTPFITETVGADAYGFVTLSKQFAQYAVIITVALNSFASRYISVSYHKGEREQANIYYSSLFYGDLLLASGLLAVAAVVTMLLNSLLIIPAELVGDVKCLFLLVFINFWITTVFTAFSTAAYVRNKLDIVGLFKGLSYLAEAVILYACYVLFPAKLIYVGFGLIGATLVVALSNLWISRCYTPDLQIHRRFFRLSAVKRLLWDGMWTSFNSLGNLLNSGLDLIVCNLMLSPLAMGQLAIAKTIDGILHAMYQVVAQAFQPMLLKSYAAEDQGKLLQELKLSMKITGLLSNLAVAGFIALGMVYYRLWIPGQDIPVVYRLTVITLLVAIPGGPMTPLYYIYTLTVKKVFPCMMTLIGGICNIAGMYLLLSCTDMGVYAVVWTTVAVMWCINFITNPLYMAYVLHLPWHTFYPNIVRNVLSCGVMILVFRGMAALYLPYSWLTLVICILLYSIVGSGIHMIIVCDGKDWKRIKRRWTEKVVENDP